MSVQTRAQLGIVDESTYGTPVTVTRFYEFNKDGIRFKPGRVKSAGLRSGHRTMRNDRAVPHRGMGAAGPIELDVMTKGFALLLKHCLGTVGTAGPTDSVYTHTIAEGAINGKSFTAQSNRPFHPADTDQAFTYHGCKVTSWELSQQVADDSGGILKLTVDVDAEDFDTSTGLASASYTASTLPYAWTHLAVTIGGSSVPVKSFKVGCDNRLTAGMDRAYARASSLKQEPVEAGLRGWYGELVADFSDLTQHNRVTAAVAASMYAQIVATWTHDVLAGVSTYPSIVCTIPAARFDDGLPEMDGNPLQVAYRFEPTYNGSASPVTLAYASTDATP